MMKQDKRYMMFRLEADLTKIVKEYLETIPKTEGKFTKISDRYHSGISDFLGSYKGHFIAIELKSETGELSANQIQYLADVALSGGKYVVARTLDEVITFLESIVDPLV